MDKGYYQQELQIGVADLEDNLAWPFKAEKVSILGPEITPGYTYRETECLSLPLLFFFFIWLSQSHTDWDFKHLPQLQASGVII